MKGVIVIINPKSDIFYLLTELIVIARLRLKALRLQQSWVLHLGSQCSTRFQGMKEIIREPGFTSEHRLLFISDHASRI